MVAGKPPPLTSRAYLSTPGPPSAPPSPTPKLPRLPVPSPPFPPIWGAGCRTIAAARAPSLSVKLLNLSHSLLLRARGSHVYPFESAGTLAPQRARRRRPLKPDRRCRSPPPPSPPSLSRPSKLHRVVKKLLPASLLFLPSRAPRRRSLAGNRPSPWTPCRGRRLSHPCKHMFRFAKSSASRRCLPRTI
jgi:hypothetical protein